VLFAAMWAAGMTSDEMAEFSLSWQPADYLDIQWARLPRLAFSALRGYSGLAKGEAVERLFDRRLWHMSAGETEIALHTAVYAIASERVKYFGSIETPHLTLGELVRIAVAQPLLAEAVRVEGELYVDGGTVDALPAEPFIGDRDFDRVFALDLLSSVAPLDPPTAELARRGREHLGASFVPIVPISRDAVHGFPFYDLFLDRRRWPELMRRGYDAAREALA
jgi:NTE family protein